MLDIITLHAPSLNLLHWELLFLPTNDAPLYRIPFSTGSQTRNTWMWNTCALLYIYSPIWFYHLLSCAMCFERHILCFIQCNLCGYSTKAMSDLRGCSAVQDIFPSSPFMEPSSHSHFVTERHSTSTWLQVETYFLILHVRNGRKSYNCTQR
jgi:hypothetical protein